MTFHSHHLHLLFAHPSQNQDYQHIHFNQLDKTDQMRLQSFPHLAQRLDWRVSRVLKHHIYQNNQYLNFKIHSLSHSWGLAGVIASSQPQFNMMAGIDVEKIRPCAYLDKAKWVCSEPEYHFLQNQNLEAFYRLWCVKEALLKAQSLSFPDQMMEVGYHFDSNGKIKSLRTPTPAHHWQWQGLTALIEHEWALAVVWQSNDIINIHHLNDLNWQFLGDFSENPINQIHYIHS